MARKIPVYQIDSDVPIPDEEEKIRRQALPLESLDIGESFVFPSEYRRYVQSKASVLKRRKGLGYTIRQEQEGACRVWRTA